MTAIEDIHIDDDRAMELLREVVAEKGPDHVYSRLVDGHQGACLYWHSHEKGPGCIVGHVLYKAGWTSRDLGRLEMDGPIAFDQIHLPDSIDSRAVYLLTTAQSVQDSHRPWGDALAEAEATYKAIKEQANE